MCGSSWEMFTYSEHVKYISAHRTTPPPHLHLWGRPHQCFRAEEVFLGADLQWPREQPAAGAQPPPRCLHRHRELVPGLTHQGSHIRKVHLVLSSSSEELKPSRLKVVPEGPSEYQIRFLWTVKVRADGCCLPTRASSSSNGVPQCFSSVKLKLDFKIMEPTKA